MRRVSELMGRHEGATHARWLTLLFGAVISGCPGGADTTDLVHDASVDQDATADAGLALDAAADDAEARADAASTDAGSAGKAFGQVLVQQSSDPAWTMGWTAGATFTSDWPGPGCVGSSSGPCQIELCASAPMPPPVLAGTITVTIPSRAAAIVMNPDAISTYDGPMGQGTAFRAGEPIRFQATGSAGGVPPFDDSLLAPAPVELTQPPVVVGQPIEITRASGMPLSWVPSATSAGGLYVNLWLVRPDQSYAQIECSFPLAAGGAVVPAAALAQLPAGDGAITIGSDARGTTSAGSYVIELDALSLSVFLHEAILH
jgi:hypothetical protein